MSEYRRKVQRGERATAARSASLHNAAVDAVRDAPPVRSSVVSSGAVDLRRWSVDDILVLNDTGTYLGRFAVVALGELVVTPEGSASSATMTGGLDCQFPCFYGKVPSRDYTNFAVLQAPLAEGKIGRARTSGATPARVTGPTGRNLADMEFGSTEHLTTAQGTGDEGHADVVWRAPSDDDLSFVRLDNSHVGRVHFGVLRAFTSGAWDYDVYGSTFASLEDPPIATDGRAISGVGNLRAGELVVIVENHLSGGVEQAAAFKFFSDGGSYGVPEGLVGLMVLTPDEDLFAAAHLRCIVESTDIIEHFDGGSNLDPLWFEFDFGSWHGVGGAQANLSTAVLLGERWILAEATELHETRLAALQGACNGAAVPSAASTSQDSIPLGAPNPVPGSGFALELGRGVVFYTATPTSGDYRFVITFPISQPDPGSWLIFATSVSAVVSVSFSSHVTSQPSSGSLFPGMAAMLPTVPYFSFTPLTEPSALGWFHTAIASTGYAEAGLIEPANKITPNIEAHRAMPSGGSDATGTYDLIPSSTEFESLNEPTAAGFPVVEITPQEIEVS